MNWATLWAIFFRNSFGHTGGLEAANTKMFGLPKTDLISSCFQTNGTKRESFSIKRSF
jgi:hypothetical protein